jgi:hypothetical protein
VTFKVKDREALLLVILWRFRNVINVVHPPSKTMAIRPMNYSLGSLAGFPRNGSRSERRKGSGAPGLMMVYGVRGCIPSKAYADVDEHERDSGHGWTAIKGEEAEERLSVVVDEHEDAPKTDESGGQLALTWNRRLLTSRGAHSQSR